MITAIIISGILVIFIIGFVQVYNRHNRVVKKIDFAGEYRNNSLSSPTNISKLMTVGVGQVILMVSFMFGSL
jgi:hypothetical protein